MARLVSNIENHLRLYFGAHLLKIENQQFTLPLLLSAASFAWEFLLTLFECIEFTKNNLDST